MAVLRNLSGETLSLFRPDAPPIDADGEVTVRDENFVDRAWPKVTWELVSPPEVDGYVDASTDDAWQWLPAPEPEVDLSAMTKPQLIERAAEAGLHLDAPVTKAEILAALSKES